MDRLGLVAIVVAAVLVAACSGGDSGSGETESTPEAAATASPAGAAAATATSTAAPGATSEASSQPGGCTMHPNSTPPATYFGLIGPGTIVRAVNVDCGIECGSTTADGAGEWLIVVDRSAPCLPSPGHTIAFSLDGQLTGHSEVWRPGGAPENLATGIALVAP